MWKLKMKHTPYGLVVSLRVLDLFSPEVAVRETPLRTVLRRGSRSYYDWSNLGISPDSRPLWDRASRCFFGCFRQAP